MMIPKPVWGGSSGTESEPVTNSKLNQMTAYAEQLAGGGGVSSGGGAGGGSPLTITLTSSSLASSASDATKSAKLARVFTLSKVTTSRAAWVRLYGNAASRTADLARGLNDDPAEGVLIALDFVTTAGDLVCETPNVLISDSQATDAGLPATIINFSSATGTVAVSFDLLPLQNYAT